MFMGIYWKPNSPFIMSTYLDLTASSPNILGELCLAEAITPCLLWLSFLRGTLNSYLLDSPDWLSLMGVSVELGLSTVLVIGSLLICFFVCSFSQFHSREGYFCLPSNLINAGWWQIRKERLWRNSVHQGSSSFFPFSLWGELQTVSMKTLWTESSLSINLTNIRLLS